jgi:asparagine N-glycosylation enzyme membrane subunit Stt3
MKNTRFMKMGAAIMFGLVMIPMVSFAQNSIPTIKLLGVQEISSSKSVAHVLVTAPETLDTSARVYVEFTDIENDETNMTAYAIYTAQGETSNAFWMSNLVQGHTYEYRAVMEFDNENYRTSLKKFTQGHEVVTVNNSNTTTHTSTTQETVVTTPTQTADSSILGSFFGTSTAKVTTDLQNKVMTGGGRGMNRMWLWLSTLVTY